MNIILKLGKCSLVQSHSATGLSFYYFDPYTILNVEREEIFESRRTQQNIKQLLVKSARDRRIFVPNTNMCWLDSSILYDFDTDSIVIMRVVKGTAILTMVNYKYNSQPLIDRYIKKIIELARIGVDENVLITSEAGMGRVFINQVVEVEDVQQFLSLALNQEVLPF